MYTFIKYILIVFNKVIALVHLKLYAVNIGQIIVLASKTIVWNYFVKWSFIYVLTCVVHSVEHTDTQSTIVYVDLNLF